MPIQNNYLLKSSLGLFALGVLNSAFSQKSEKPDIVIIYADDLGYGDVSGLGPRGDAILEFDWSVGEILKTLNDLDLTRKTIVIVTSDNGPVIDDGYKDEAVEKLNGHKPSGPLRGGKYSAFDGGTRVAFIVRWEGKIDPGTSDALISQVDFLSSFASLTGQTLPYDAAPDSFDQIQALLGKSKTGNDTVPQLYNIGNDLGEKMNIASENPFIVKELTDLLRKIKADGRTR